MYHYFLFRQKSQLKSEQNGLVELVYQGIKTLLGPFSPLIITGVFVDRNEEP